MGPILHKWLHIYHYATIFLMFGTAEPIKAQVGKSFFVMSDELSMM